MSQWEKAVTLHSEYGLVDDINDIYKAMIEAAGNELRNKRSIVGKHMFMKCLAQGMIERVFIPLLDDEVSDLDAIDEYKRENDLFAENHPAIEEYE